MSHNMSIYKRLNPRLLVQAGLGLGLLHWANMSNIYISNILYPPFIYIISQIQDPPLTTIASHFISSPDYSDND